MVVFVQKKKKKVTPHIFLKISFFVLKAIKFPLYPWPYLSATNGDHLSKTKASAITHAYFFGLFPFFFFFFNFRPPLSSSSLQQQPTSGAGATTPLKELSVQLAVGAPLEDSIATRPSFFFRYPGQRRPVVPTANSQAIFFSGRHS